ncbi:DUF1674-domain-containing protein [Terfezia boudieri ATCC MYA-4762]|uniref:Succinate dehydrogenase assembly factor 4, mitochondrial n=1 Tax=Terfezia boudieri ATCC MYA-4762 TaxID=1051890 RepID=A0A3N4LRZ6_9PEZI|nr:DUF1674-domain-containing protein [Terfezia boudieri ATCC MYA-4762]
MLAPCRKTPAAARLLGTATAARTRLLSTSSILRSGSGSPIGTHFSPGPSPPRLPAQQQAEFERLQKLSHGAFSQPASPTSAPTSENGTIPELGTAPGEMLHPNIRRGAPPEFEGDVNPKTGEVGGPKNDPLRWKGDWSYNGRVTDF